MAPRIVTSRFDQADGHTLPGYLATGGYDGLRKALATTPAEVIAEVKTAGITGRSGGAAFLTAQKWELLVDKDPKWLVINGDESEPGFCKDRALMERDPHQLIEGALICAYAIGAAKVFLYVRGEMAVPQERIAAALNEAYDAGYLGSDILGSGWSMDMVLHWGAGAYIVGEETGLIESLEGKRAFPRAKPPFYPTTYGLYQQPTVVNNVETLAALPWILVNGGTAFAALGGNRSFGTRMFSVSGHVNKPGNYEVELVDNTFRDLIESPSYAGGVRNGNKLKAFFLGASFPWLGPDDLDLTLDIDVTPPRGTPLGPGIVVMDETTCPVRAAWRLVRFYAHESCGQCTPCREGGDWLEKVMYRLESGAGRKEDLEVLLDVCATISPGVQWPFKWPPSMTTICALGPSIPPSILSSLNMFRDDYLAHIENAGCPYD